MIASNIATASGEIPLQILHLEDSALDHELVRRTLMKSGLAFALERVETLPSFVQATRNRLFQIVLADFRLPGFTALDAWSSMSAQNADTPFVLLSGAIGEAAAVSAIQMGISDYLHKDELDKLPRVIHRALEVRQVRSAQVKAQQELQLSQKRLAAFAEHLQTTIENERASIAREIHDDIGGALAAAKLDLAWLARHTDAKKAVEHIQAASDMLQHALGASQRIMMNLRPAILDQGLLPAMQWLVSNFEKRTGIATSIATNKQPMVLEQNVELVAYRTTQEALTNISKYAECSQVRIELSDAEGVLTLEIADNGKGIPQEALDKPSAFGLRGLKERAKSIDGWLDVSSMQGAGTSITLSVPLSTVTAPFGEDQFK